MASDRPAAPLALDTNPFLLLVTYRYLESKNATAPERMRALTDVRGQPDYLPPESFDELWYIFEHANRRITTQHVVAEALKARAVPLLPTATFWTPGAAPHYRAAPARVRRQCPRCCASPPDSFCPATNAGWYRVMA